MELLERLRPLLRASVPPERMLRSVAALLAIEIGPYCIADVINAKGVLQRLDIEHPDPGRRDRLRVTAQNTVHETGGRVARLLASGGSELTSRVTASARVRSLSDIVLFERESVESYMATVISVSGGPMALLTLVSPRATRRFDRRDLEFLAAIGDWTGLALENALRRELQPRASVMPPPLVAQPALAGAPARLR